MIQTAITLARKVPRKIREISKQWQAEHVLTTISQAEATEVLAAIYPDEGGNCVATEPHRIEPKYDLQVIVPVYKVERFVKACIDSILNQQTRFNFCVTIVNDGSPDGSREILKQYEGLPNVQIIDQENKGLSGARNTALRRIGGGM